MFEITTVYCITESDAGPKRILVDSLLPRVKDMSTTEFETDFNVSFYSSYFFLPKDQTWSQTESSIFHVLFCLFERMHFYFIFFPEKILKFCHFM